MFNNRSDLPEKPSKTTRPSTLTAAGLTVLDTDLFYDPDDFVTLVIAAQTVTDLVVMTADETRGRRAQLARHVLDLMDRPDVPVIAGIDIGGEHRFVMDEFVDQSHTTDADPDPGGAVLDAADGLANALTRLCAATDGPIHWVGMGPMTNLSAVLCLVPDLAERIVVTQMGGWLDRYRDKTRASHNFHTDPVSAGIALRLIRTPRLVLSDFTNSSAIDVTDDWELLRRLRSATAPRWAQLLAANFEAWFQRQRAKQNRRGSWMHDPLTLSAALGLPFVTFTPERIRIERDARIYRDPGGRAMEVACAVDNEGFVEWMHEGVCA
ncbi:nucleoside hydrolase [Nocardia sp. NPDC052112]|uniref:nucleoside hydrolase n=1 Tax=Nocardia sp. NPDC052112 TaxID=3155646 RepID=UPI0034125B60